MTGVADSPLDVDVDVFARAMNVATQLFEAGISNLHTLQVFSSLGFSDAASRQYGLGTWREEAAKLRDTVRALENPELKERCLQILDGRLDGLSVDHAPNFTTENIVFLEKRWKKHVVAKQSLSSRLQRVDKDPEMRRADGRCVCTLCALSYYDHPEHPVEPTMTVLCDGSIVKL